VLLRSLGFREPKGADAIAMLSGSTWFDIFCFDSVFWTKSAPNGSILCRRRLDTRGGQPQMTRRGAVKQRSANRTPTANRLQRYCYGTAGAAYGNAICGSLFRELVRFPVPQILILSRYVPKNVRSAGEGGSLREEIPPHNAAVRMSEVAKKARYSAVFLTRYDAIHPGATDAYRRISRKLAPQKKGAKGPEPPTVPKCSEIEDDRHE
jgi:hypothetical protein